MSSQRSVLLAVLAVCLCACACTTVLESEIPDVSDPALDDSVHLTPHCANGKCGYLDQKGDFAIPQTFKVAKPFYGGLASVYVEGSGWGAIDPVGSYVVPPRFAWIGPFSEGLAGAALSEKNLYEWAYIDRTGKITIRLNYHVERAYPFHNGKAWVTCPFLFSEMSKEIDRSGHVLKNLYPH